MPAPDQPQEPVDEHFRAAVEALVKAASLTAVDAVGAQAFQHLAVLGAVPVTHDQCLRNRVPERANADLQGSTVSDEAAGVQSDRVVRCGDLVVRWREHRVRGRRVGHDQIEKVRLHHGTAEHERHLPVHHADLDQRHALFGILFDHFKSGHQDCSTD